MNSIIISNFIFVLLIFNVFFGFKRTTNLYCGLVGYTGKVPFDKWKIKILMLYNESRGVDSSGFYMFDKSKTTPINQRFMKTLGKTSTNLLQKFTPQGSECFIGHTRNSTMGHKDLNCAHPFIIPDEKTTNPLIGAHNGLLTNNYDLLDKLNETFSTCPVDSMTIFKLLYQSETYAQGLELLGSDTNAVLFTRDDGILYAFRMKERPLYYGYIKSNKPNDNIEGMYISSILESLEAINCVDIKEFIANFLYKIVNGEIKEQIFISNSPYKRPVSNNTITVSEYNARNSTKELIFEEEIVYNFTVTRLLGQKTSFKELSKQVFDEHVLATVHLINHPCEDLIPDDEDTDTNNETSCPFTSTIPSIETDDESIHEVPDLDDIQDELTEEEKEMYEKLKTRVVEYLVSAANTMEHLLNNVSEGLKNEDYTKSEVALTKLKALKTDIRNETSDIQMDFESESSKTSVNEISL